jgi:antitoxin MazE
MAQFLSIQARGTVSLPVALRRKYRLDEPGAQVEVIDADGEIILRPKLAFDAHHAWFWDEAWQAGERQAETERQTGQGEEFDSGEALIAHLDESE